jgi:hypothetical protein
MLFRLVAASTIVGAIVVMSPARQGSSIPALPDGVAALGAGALRDGLMDAFDPRDAPAARQSEPVREAVAAAIVRGVVAQQSERARRSLSAAREPGAKHAASSDTLQPGDRAPGWRGGVAGP